jgi:glycosyltransferase involved in cell wall biosynthesis
MESQNSKSYEARLSQPVRVKEQIWPDDVCPLVSICCFTYNHKEFIKEAIEGFLMQKTTFPVEIIIRDDASTDGTSEIVKSYSERHPQIIRPILLTKNQHSQRREAFTNIISGVSGDYIALCEGDDYWISENKLHEQVSLLKKYAECSFCFHTTNIINQGGMPSGRFKPISNQLIHELPELFGHNFIHTSSIVLRKSKLDRFPDWFYEVPMGDWPLCILLAEKGNFLYLDKVLSHYRHHDSSNWSSKSLANQYQGISLLFEKLCQHFKDKPNYPNAKRGYVINCINAAKEYKREGNFEVASFFYEKVVESLTNSQISDPISEKFPVAAKNSLNQINGSPNYKDSKSIMTLLPSTWSFPVRTAAA